MATAIVASKPAPCDLFQSFDTLYSVATRLQALLAMTYGCEQGAAFRLLNDGLQDTYLAQCAEMTGQMIAVLSTAADQQFAEVSHG